MNFRLKVLIIVAILYILSLVTIKITADPIIKELKSDVRNLQECKFDIAINELNNINNLLSSNMYSDKDKVLMLKEYCVEMRNTLVSNKNNVRKDLE
jgi:hypothetical protein